MLKKILPLLSFVCLSSFAQSPEEINKMALIKFTSMYPMEKIYVHTDKPYYAAGDTLWFNAYIVNAVLHQPDSASGVVYLDLINLDQNKIVVHKVIRAAAGTAHGAVSLGDSLQQGSYQLRAYTNWMLNFSESLFFTKSISIYETDRDDQNPNMSELHDAISVNDIRFYPEGGNFVAGLPNRVAFKAVNKFGKGIDVAGFVLSNKGDTVTHARSQHLGMGYFTITPENGKSYSFYISGTEKNRFPLPPLIKEGYVMMVDNLNKTSVKVFVHHNFSYPDRGILIAHQRGKIIYAAQAGSDKNSFGFVIPKESISEDGVVHLTLFKANGIPQCERIVYRNKNEPLRISITPDKSQYRPREKVSFEIQVTDSRGIPVKGNFSLSVTDSHQVKKESYGENIETYLLLSSDVQESFQNEVKGNIEEPAYYFDGRNSKAEVHLDLLLMTQGWRRFTWPEILQENHPTPIHRIENGITVSGQVMQPNGKPSKKPIDLVLLYKGGLVTKTADENGRFVVDDLDLPDTTHVLLQGTKSSGGKNVIAKFDKPFIPDITKFSSTPAQRFSKDDIDYWLKQRLEHEQFEKSLKLQKVQMLKAVEITAKRIERDPRRSLYGSNISTIKVDERNCTTVSNFLQLLQSRVPSLQVSGALPNLKLTLRGSTPAFLVDGIPAYDLNVISFIAPCDIEAIDISTTPTPLVPGNKSGLISILTRRGNANYDWTQEAAKGISVTEVIGFDSPREFYSPTYEKEKDENAIPDLRATLYWKPNIITNSEGKAFVSFYNSDLGSTINASLEGISVSGRPVATNVQYVVK